MRKKNLLFLMAGYVLNVVAHTIDVYIINEDPSNSINFHLYATSDSIRVQDFNNVVLERGEAKKITVDYNTHADIILKNYFIKKTNETKISPELIETGNLGFVEYDITITLSKLEDCDKTAQIRIRSFKNCDYELEIQKITNPIKMATINFNLEDNLIGIIVDYLINEHFLSISTTS